MTTTWDDLLAQLEAIIVQSAPNEVTELQRGKLLSLLESYDSNLADFKQFIHYDDSGYTKNLVKRFGHRCNVIVMCWAPGQSSAFHAHEGSKCFVKVLCGQLIEQQVAYPTSVKISLPANQTTRLLSTNDVTYIDDTIGLHKVRNNSTQEPAITLHIYTPPYTKCRIFAEDDRHSLSIDNSQSLSVTFHTELGSKLN